MQTATSYTRWYIANNDWNDLVKTATITAFDNPNELKQTKINNDTNSAVILEQYK